MANRGAFWEDLARDLEDPGFLREYVVESMRIATLDAVVNALDEAREAAGLSKAELARAIQIEPATIRRLFASDKSNPTLGTLAEVAAALGMRITIEPLPEEERVQVTNLSSTAVPPMPRAWPATSRVCARARRRFRRNHQLKDLGFRRRYSSPRRLTAA
jgi:transcriptional regulator with XRE-family HTH domain